MCNYTVWQTSMSFWRIVHLASRKISLGWNGKADWSIRLMNDCSLNNVQFNFIDKPNRVGYWPNIRVHFVRLHLQALVEFPLQIHWQCVGIQKFANSWILFTKVNKFLQISDVRPFANIFDFPYSRELWTLQSRMVQAFGTCVSGNSKPESDSKGIVFKTIHRAITKVFGRRNARACIRNVNSHFLIRHPNFGFQRRNSAAFHLAFHLFSSLCCISRVLIIFSLVEKSSSLLTLPNLIHLISPSVFSSSFPSSFFVIGHSYFTFHSERRSTSASVNVRRWPMTSWR